ncbi:MAG: transglutaminase family protein [Fibrobacteres bacterium]|nr:transglutaminase family protein [Fibrobacterota bacterium]
MEQYLQSTRIIDYNTSIIKDKAAMLSDHMNSELDIVKSCFEFVRDSIKHSWDFKINVVTCNASDVLTHQTGFCYAKSHLLASLLRANNIPTGFCYQRLSVGIEGPPFCLHGLNAVFLQKYGWLRIDARGNKPGVTASFNPPIEQLAFLPNSEDEITFPEIWPEPLPIVIDALNKFKTIEELYMNLPDIEIIKPNTNDQNE